MRTARAKLIVRKSATAAALLGVGVVVAACLIYGPSGDLPLALVLGHDTAYAERFSEAAWRGLRRGIPVAEVERALGPPLKVERYPGGRETWSYSESPGGGNYWMRMVHMRGGAVEKTASGFYVD